MKPKDQGGLAMLNLEDMNQACLMTLGWALRKCDDNLCAQVLKEKYARNGISNYSLAVKVTDSFIWKALAKQWNSFALSNFIGSHCEVIL